MLPEGRGIPWVLKNADDGPERPGQGDCTKKTGRWEAAGGTAESHTIVLLKYSL